MNDSTSKELSQSLMAVGGLLGAVALIGIFVFGMAKNGYGNNELTAEGSQSGDVLSRIRPVVTLDDIMAVDAEPAKPMATGVKSGKELYDGACMACHSTGVAGAPKPEDTNAWQPRFANGVDALVNSVVAGKGAMPPKGGSAYSEEELRAAVEYILQQAGLMSAGTADSSNEQASPSSNQGKAAEVEPASMGSGADLAAGEADYKTACFACHDSGAAGAPKLGDSAAWTDRLSTGTDTLNASAISGKGAMPPKGGAIHLSDEAVKNIVAFMVSRVQ